MFHLYVTNSFKQWALSIECLKFKNEIYSSPGFLKSVNIYAVWLRWMSQQHQSSRQAKIGFRGLTPKVQCSLVVGREDRAGISYHHNVDATTLALCQSQISGNGEWELLGKGAKLINVLGWGMRGSIIDPSIWEDCRMQTAFHLSVLGLGWQVGLIGIFKSGSFLVNIRLVQKIMANQTLLLHLFGHTL